MKKMKELLAQREKLLAKKRARERAEAKLKDSAANSASGLAKLSGAEKPMTPEEKMAFLNA
jgi:hypothetical protein